MFFIKEIEVCNFASDTTIYPWSLNYEEVHQKSSNYAHIVLNWFQINNVLGLYNVDFHILSSYMHLLCQN